MDGPDFLSLLCELQTEEAPVKTQFLLQFYFLCS